MTYSITDRLAEVLPLWVLDLGTGLFSVVVAAMLTAPIWGLVLWAVVRGRK